MDFSRTLVALLHCRILEDGVVSVIYANPGVEKLFGYQPKVFLRRPLTQVLPSLKGSRVLAEIRSLARQGGFGQLSPVECGGRILECVVSPAGVETFHLLFLDITDRKLVEGDRTHRDQQFRRLIERAPLPTMIHAEDGQILLWSRSWSELSGYALGEVRTIHRWTELAFPDRARKMQQYIKTLYSAQEPIEEGDEEVTCADGATRIWRFFSAPGGRLQDGRRLVMTYAVDETERRSREETFLLSEKLETVGGLAGGLAHDFNNILTGIQGYTEIVRDDMDPDSQAHEDLGEILDLSRRAARLIRRLLAFSRRQQLQVARLNVNDLLKRLRPKLESLLDDSIEVEYRLAENLSQVEADAGQLEEMLHDLFNNAREAMPDGGVLTIETDEVELDYGYAEQHRGVVPGHYVKLSISDTGEGMDSTTQSRVFEPFFTTKEQRVGLGLSTVYGIVKQHEGNIWVYSEPDEGTTFKVYLPWAPRTAKEPAPA